MKIFNDEQVDLKRSCMQKMDETEQDVSYLRDEIAAVQTAALSKTQTLVVNMQNQALMRIREGAGALAAKDQELQALSSKLCRTTEALAEKNTQVERQVSEILALKKSTNNLLAEEKEMHQEEAPARGGVHATEEKSSCVPGQGSGATSAVLEATQHTRRTGSAVFGSR